MSYLSLEESKDSIINKEKKILIRERERVSYLSLEESKDSIINKEKKILIRERERGRERGGGG